MGRLGKLSASDLEFQYSRDQRIDGSEWLAKACGMPARGYGAE